MPGALEGLKIVELAGLGPAPFAGMMLADHGAEVFLVKRPPSAASGRAAHIAARDILSRSRTVIELDLKSPDGIAQIRALAATADGLIEGFRPGVMERLGLGPDILLQANPKLVYGRMTGWARPGPTPNPPAMTSTTSPSPAICTATAGQAKNPRRPSTPSEISAAAA